jgi:hypothetical protein
MSRKYNAPLLIALALLFIIIAYIEYGVLKQTNGQWAYPLDDAFIHMCLAKNLALHGNWGINPFEFGSASSSLLFTVLLTVLFLIFSAHTVIPLVINCIAGVFLLWAIDRWLRRQEISDRARGGILIGVLFFTPLPVLAITGMEHVLQCLFTFLFLYSFADWIEGQKAAKAGGAVGHRWRLPSSLAVLGMLTTAIRYEGMFLVAIACLVLLYYRQIMAGVRLGLVSLLPLIVFGVYSLTKHSYFFPNSVLLKSEKVPFSLHGIVGYVSNLIMEKLTIINAVTGPPSPKPGISLLAAQQLLWILPALFLLFRGQLRRKIGYAWVLIMLGALTLLHLSFASTGWFYRYEAYLICCAVPIAGVVLVKNIKGLPAERMGGVGLIGLGLLAALVFPLVFRSVVAYSKAKIACINIYDQQYQMGLFLHDHYNHDVIAMNDVGAVCYMTEGKNLDLWGLGCIDVAKSKKEGYFSPAFLDSLSRSRGVKIAVVYDSWFSDTLRSKWTKVATWKIPDNVICGDPTVTFYAVAAGADGELRMNLQKFRSRLPAGVEVKYY